MPSRAGKSGKEQTRRSSAYTPNFAQRLVDNGIFLAEDTPEPANYQEQREVVSQPRPSLSPSSMSDGHWRRFRKAAREAANDDEVMSHVLPKLVGDSPYPSRQNVRLLNLDPLVPDVVTPQPDYYEGHVLGIGNRLRRQLDTSIVPPSHRHHPFLPNCFAKAKGPSSAFEALLGWLRFKHAMMEP